MRIPTIVLSLFLPLSASAAWYEDKSIDWWMVVFSGMKCEKAKDVNSEYQPVTLINNKQCTYEPDNSTEGATASIGCEKTMSTGFIFATSKEACETAVKKIQDSLKDF